MFFANVVLSFIRLHQLDIKDAIIRRYRHRNFKTLCCEQDLQLCTFERYGILDIAA